MAELRWRRKIGKTANKYPHLYLPVEFADWIGREVELTYDGKKLTITLVKEEGARGP